MPVTAAAYDAFGTHTFSEESYRNLYTVLSTVKNDYTLLREPSFSGYYGRVNGLYAAIRKVQSSLPARVESGESAAALAAEMWDLFRAVK